jgi:hypothetical protein
MSNQRPEGHWIQDDLQKKPATTSGIRHHHEPIRSLTVKQRSHTPGKERRHPIFHNQRNFRPPNPHTHTPKEARIHETRYGRGFWHRFFDTLLSSQGADAHRTAPSGTFSGQPFKLSQMFRTGQIRVTNSNRAGASCTPQDADPVREDCVCDTSGSWARDRPPWCPLLPLFQRVELYGPSYKESNRH